MISIQNFLDRFGKSIMSLIKVVLLSKFFLKKYTPENPSPDCIILGNSPSLENSLASNPEFLTGKDLFAVNFFWKSKNFNKIKPKFYVIASTNYWSENQIPTNKEGRLNTFKEISKIVDWEMILFVPAMAKRFKDWKEEIAQNKYIKIVYFNLTPVDGFRFLSFWLFRSGLGMPRPHNVLIPSIKFAIDLNYKSIYILGAEHSWLKDLFVGEDNVVYLSQKHFYDFKTAKPDVMYKGSTNVVRNLSETLMKFVHSFNSYYVLEEYAKKYHSKVFNCTKDSYIDAFERLKLPNDY